MSEPGGDPSSGISSGDALIRPERHPACRRREARPGFRMERENLCFVTPPGVKGQAASGSNREGESTEAGRRGGAARSSVEGPVMGLERRGCVVRPWPLANWKREEPVDEAKPFKDVMSWQRPNIGSRVTREGHARFWERPEVKFLRATRRLRRFERGAVNVGSWHNPDLPGRPPSRRYRMVTGPSATPVNTATVQHPATHPIRSTLQQLHHIGLRTAEHDASRPPSLMRCNGALTTPVEY
jgi:hypothetical protein